MSKQVNYNENLCAGAAIRDDKGRRISKLFEASHPKMTVGYAKNLIMPDTPTEQEFNFRQSGGGVIEDGVAVIDKVKGNSMVWNQLIKDFREPSNWLTGGNDVTIVGDKIHIKFASTSPLNAFGVKSSAFSAGHKYCLLMNNENAVPLTAIKLGSASSVSNSGSTMNSPEMPFITVAIPAGSAGDAALWFWPSDEAQLEGDFSNIYCIDLTQMFGAGNEPTTYEEFLQRKPKVADEYAYNEGTIVNNKVEAVVTTGRNLWDEEWEVGEINEITCQNQTSSSDIRSKNFIRVIGGNNYFFKHEGNGTLRIFQYDADKNPILSWNSIYNFKSIKNNYFSLQANCVYIRFCTYNNYGTTYNHDICINLSDPAINGQYFPYEKHELDLSWVKDIKDAEGVKLFEDGMKSAGTAFDEAAKGRAIKRIGVKVFDGTESFTDYLVNYGSFAIMRDAFVGVGSSIGISNRYAVSRFWESDPDRTKYDKQIYIDSINNRVWIRDSAFADVDSLKQYLAELYAAGTPLVLYYELAEPIEVEYDEKNLTYPVVAGGTEEAIASEPSSAFRADIGYGIDAVKTILDLKARVEALEGK